MQEQVQHQQAVDEAPVEVVTSAEEKRHFVQPPPVRMPVDQDNQPLHHQRRHVQRPVDQMSGLMQFRKRGIEGQKAAEDEGRLPEKAEEFEIIETDQMITIGDVVAPGLAD